MALLTSPALHVLCTNATILTIEQELDQLTLPARQVRAAVWPADLAVMRAFSERDRGGKAALKVVRAFLKHSPTVSPIAAQTPSVLRFRRRATSS